MSNHLLVQLQRQHILLSYFKTLSVGPVWDLNPRPPAQQTGALPTELTRRRSDREMFELLKLSSNNCAKLAFALNAPLWSTGIR